MKSVLITLTLFVFLFNSKFAQAKDVMTITYHTQQSKTDKRFEYDKHLLKLALEKTKDKYGEYSLVPLKTKTNYKRILHLEKYKKIENLFFKHSVTKEKLENFGYVPFPVDLGIVGYRVSFISKKIKEKLKNVNTFEDLQKFTMLQGIGWLDIDILKHHKLKVIEGSSYKGLFGMVAIQRGDIFFRGANELFEEWHTNKHIENLTYDESIALYYPLPRFFFSSKKNTKAIKRIKEGLELAYNDGSLKKLWESHYLESVVFSKLHKRKIFKLENPFIKDINKEYEKYIYKP